MLLDMTPERLREQMDYFYGHIPLDELNEFIYDSEEEVPDFMESVYRYMINLDEVDLLPDVGATSDSINAFVGYYKDDRQFAKYWLEQALLEEHINRYYPSFMVHCFDLEKVAKYLFKEDLSISPFVAIMDEECICVFSNIGYPCYTNQGETF